MSEIMQAIEQEQITDSSIVLKSKVAGKKNKTKTVGKGAPGTLIDTLIEWENNPEHDDFWA